jgi:hypothetical protein
MFESIVSTIIITVRHVVRAVGAAMRKSPWVAPAAIVLFFLVV